jgi:hypothetical protein
MGKEWDKALPSTETWKECLRVLKPGGFAFVMSAPRSDVLSRMIVRIEDAGFNVCYTPMYHTYASGFPKSLNIHKKLTKDAEAGQHRLQDLLRTALHQATRTGDENHRPLMSSLLAALEQGTQHKVFAYARGEGESIQVSQGTGERSVARGTNVPKAQRELCLCKVCALPCGIQLNGPIGWVCYGAPDSDGSISWTAAHADGVRAPFKSSTTGQPHQQFEVICEQCRAQDVGALAGTYGGFNPKPAVEVVIVASKPLSEKTYVDQALKNGKGVTWLDECRVPSNRTDTRHGGGDAKVYGKYEDVKGYELPSGRFPANLLVQDDVLNEYSRYFSLDEWAAKLPDRVRKTLPFLIVPKASKREKNEGLAHLPKKRGGGMQGTNDGSLKTGSGNDRDPFNQNFHPTVKPLQLMSYLITLGSRPGDTILDPFAGSFTTGCAAKLLGRNYICIEREDEYFAIGLARLAATDQALF